MNKSTTFLAVLCTLTGALMKFGQSSSPLDLATTHSQVVAGQQMQAVFDLMSNGLFLAGAIALGYIGIRAAQQNLRKLNL